jgi:hypothetical protein
VEGALNLLILTPLAWWGVVGSVCVVRALPLVAEWTNKGIKPWACDLCMSFWTSVAALAALSTALVDATVLFLIPVLTGLSIATLGRLHPTPSGGGPVDFPPLTDSGAP